MIKNKFRLFQLLLLACVGAAFIWGFHVLIFEQMPGVFTDPVEDMSFAWYVPLFSLYVLWTDRKKLQLSVGEMSVCGALATLPFLFLGYLGVRGVQIRFGIVAVIGLLITLPWAIFGRKVSRVVFFPAIYLLFCIPLATFLDVITVHLRLLASSVSVLVLHGFGADVIRKGSMVIANDGTFSIDVASPCSGLRSIFALMALTAGYAYYNQPTWFRRGLLFATSIPLAIFGNVMRILSICFVANYASKDFALGFYHDYSGYVVFFVAILLMVLCGEGINKIFAMGTKKTEQQEEEAKEKVYSKSFINFTRIFVTSFLLAVIIPAFLYLATTPKVKLMEAPNISLGEIPGYASIEVEASEAEKTVLPSDTTIIKRRYENSNGEWFFVSVVIGGSSKSSIHRPELCLPSQGFQMVSPRTRNVDGRDWRFITLDQNNGSSIGFAYTFFNQDNFKTASHIRRISRDVWDRSIHNQIDRWVMVTINCSSSDDLALKRSIENLKGFLND